MSALRIGLIGNGKMGRMIDSICAQDERFEVAGFVGPGACAALSELADLDVAVDFSYPGNVTMMLEDALRRGLPLVIGTTGLSAQQEDQIRAASAQLPIVRALNFSTGMAVMRRLARMASDALREDFDIEIVETHHNQKEDAPSGSAARSACTRCAAAPSRASTACASSARWRRSSCATAPTAAKSSPGARCAPRSSPPAQGPACTPSTT